MNKPKKFPRFNWDEITHAGDFTPTNGATLTLAVTDD